MLQEEAKSVVEGVAAVNEEGSGDDAATNVVPDLNNVRPVEKHVFTDTSLASHLAEALALTSNDDASEGGESDTSADAGALISGLVARQEATREDILGDDAFTLKGILADDECDVLVRKTEAMAYTFWNLANEGKKDYRNANTIEIYDEALAAVMWERIKHLVLPEISITPDQPRWEKGFDGTWKAVGVNPHLLFARYENGGHFSPHTDGYTIIDFNKRSLYTLLVYLNTCSNGGRTRMFQPTETREFVMDTQGRYRWDDTKCIGEGLPNIGEALAFYQDIPHEGEPVEGDGIKYIIRTDIIYERTPKLCDDPKGREAYTLFRKAEQLEADGASMQALKLYMRASKLSPEFADMMGL